MDVVVSSGVTSNGLVLHPGDSLTVSGGGEVNNGFFQYVSIEVQNGGLIDGAVLTDFSFATVDGTIDAATVANGADVQVEGVGSAFDTTVKAGGELDILAGVANETTLSVAGLMIVDGNGLASQTVVIGGELKVGGSATATSLRGGLELVTGPNSVDSDSFVLSGGVQQAVSGGVISASVVSSGGSAVAEAGGTLSGATIGSGGVTLERSGGEANSAIVSAGGVDLVSAGGESDLADIFGQQVVFSGGLATDTTVEQGGLQIVSGGVAESGNVDSGGLELVDSSGQAQNTFVLSGGSAVAETGGLLTDGCEVFSGGISIERYFGLASGTVVNSGGTDLVSSTGIAVSARVSGVQAVSGGVTRATTVFAGGHEKVYAGGIASGTIVSGGAEIVYSGGVVHGASVLGGGTLVVEAGSTIQGTVTGGGGGTLELAGGTGTLSGLFVSGNVTVSGPIPTTTFHDFGVLKLDAPTNFTAAGNSTVAAGKSLVVRGKLTTAGTLTVAGSLTLGGGATGARTLAGTGTLALTGGTTALSTGAVLTIAHVAQSGAAAVSDGTSLTYAGVWTQSGGSISVASARTLTFTGSGDGFSGSLTGAGTVRFIGGSDTFSGATLSAAHTFINGAAVSLAGAITLTQALSVTSPDLAIASAGASLTGGGTLTLTNQATNKIVGATSTAILTNVNDEIIGAGQLGGGAMILVNQASASIVGDSASVTLSIDTGAGAIGNAGLIASEGAAGVRIKSAVVNTGVLEVTAGILTAQAAVSGTGSVTIAGGTANFLAAFSQNVAFTGASGVLELAKSQSYAGKVSGFSLTGGTSLDLRDIGFTSGTTTATYVDNGAHTGGVLTVTDGTHSAHFKMVGNYSASVFDTSSDGHGGTIVVDPHKGAAAPGPAARTANVAPFIAAMAGLDPGVGHWIPTAESGWTPPSLLAAHPA